MNNFAALFAFNAAFQCSQVYRLKHTMKVIDLSVNLSIYIYLYVCVILPQELTPRRKQILEEIQQLASTEKGYKNYKERLRAINPPCVPFLGQYRSHLLLTSYLSLSRYVSNVDCLHKRW